MAHILQRDIQIFFRASMESTNTVMVTGDFNFDWQIELLPH